jgi:hypothetical protein
MKVLKFRTKRIHCGGGLAGDLLQKMLLEVPGLLGSLAKEPIAAIGSKISKFISGSGLYPVGYTARNPQLGVRKKK